MSEPRTSATPAKVTLHDKPFEMWEQGYREGVAAERARLRAAIVKAILRHPTGRLNDHEILDAFDAGQAP
jgi:hypothetical protein